jgi:hypothetical protein
MDITTSVGEVVDVLARAARCNVVEAGGGSFKLETRWMDSPISLTENTIIGILDTLRSRTVAEQTVLFDATHYETLVREESGGFAPDLTLRMGDEGGSQRRP